MSESVVITADVEGDAGVEKPTLERARAYFEGGQHLWNAGIFVWSTDTIIAELDSHAAAIMRPLREAMANGTVTGTFLRLPKVSIDSAVMEATDQAQLVQGDFDWDNIGDWVALERLLPTGPDGNDTVVGRHVGKETSGNIVYTEDDADIIVKRGNTVLLARKDRVHDLKALLADDRLGA